MAQILVRNLEDGVRDELRKRAALRGWSMAEEVRSILRAAVAHDEGAGSPLGSRISARFTAIGLTEDIPERRGQAARTADFAG
jgi:plasmid stability protein